MRRINVVGTSGSGKSTLARRLSNHLAVPYIELDSLFWLPNWQEASDEEFFRKLKAAQGDGGWVIDGNYTRSIPLKWDRVDLVVWIDLPFWLTFYQAFRRAISRALSGKEIWSGTGNRETITKTFFSRDSVLLWTITSYKSVRQKYESLMQDPQYAHIKFLRLRSRSEIEKFVSSLAK